MLTPPCWVSCVSLVAGAVLEEMMEVISERRALHRKHLHILLQEQIQNLNLSCGIGDAYHGFEFMKERCKVKDITTINHMLHNQKVSSNNNFKCSRNAKCDITVVIWASDIQPTHTRINFESYHTKQRV
jgi:hypothetical protein